MSVVLVNQFPWIINSVFFLSIYLAVLGLNCCSDFSPSFGEGGLLSSCSAQASLCGGFTCWGTGSGLAGLSSCCSQALEHSLDSWGPRAQLFHGVWDLPILGIEPRVSSIGRGTLHHWAPREVPVQSFLHWTFTESQLFGLNACYLSSKISEPSEANGPFLKWL